MGKLQLYINGHMIADWEVILPSFSSMKFKERCAAREKFLQDKAKYLQLKHLRAIMKNEDYEIYYTSPSKLNEPYHCYSNA